VKLALNQTRTPSAPLDVEPHASSPSGEFQGTERFDIVKRVGAGGMGVVYQAFDRERGTAVALKTLRQLDPAAIYHLKQEFRALADVRHPNLVELHELVSADGQWFFTMELVEGVDFLQWVRRDDVPSLSEPTVGETETERPSPRHSGMRVSARLDLDRLRDSLRQLVEGVRALHAAGKLHRDVKPSNVVITHDGRVVLLDFGLATDFVRQGTLHSIDQQVLGTPEYMSPEQGALRTLGPASDWYSVGVVLFEALTGGLPFVGSPLEIMMSKERADGPAPGTFVEGLPEDLDALCAALLRRDPSSRPNGEEILRRLTERESPRPAPLPTRTSAPPPRMPLVGRDTHLELLSRAFRRSRQGRAVAVHMHGIAGVGKSALIRQFVEDAVVTKQALVLSGACYERESVPYKAFDGVIDALTRHLRRLTRLQVEALLPRDVHTITRLFPVLGRVEAIAAAPRVGADAPDPTELRRRAFAALRELFARVADRRALVVAIDDLQWGDLDSIALLGDLLKPPYPPPMTVIAAFRDEDERDNPTLRTLREMHLNDEHKGREQPLVPALIDMRASTTARRRRRAASCEVYDLAIEPLSERDARALASTLFEGEQRSIDTLAADARGNPFLIVEYARWLRAHPEVSPERVTLERVIDARLAPMSTSARRILDVLAVAARPIDPAIVARAAHVKDERTVIRELRDAHMVRSARVGDLDALEVSHDQIRETVVARLDAPAVATLHLELANAIEATTAPDPEALANHFRAAGAKWKASHYAALAARRAETTLAFDRAASLLQLAIELAPQNAPEASTLRLHRADALFNAGRGRDAAREYLAAAEHDDHAALELHRRAAQCLLQSGHVDEGLALFEGVLSAVGERLPRSPRRALASLFFRRAQLRLRGLDYVERPLDKIPPLDLARIDVFWALTTGFGLVDVIVGADFGTRHLLAALRAGDTYRLVRAFTAEATFTAGAGLPALSRTRLLVERTKTLAEKCGQPHAFGLAQAAEAFLHYSLGEWAPARERFRRAERIFREQCSGVAWELANVRHFHLGCLAYLGELRRLAERGPALLEEASSRGDLLAQTSIRCGNASILWLAHDDPDGGRRDVADAVAHWSRRGFLLQHFYELSSQTQFDLYSGNPRVAWERLADRWPELERSLLLRMQRVRIEAWSLRARTALAAIPGASDPRELTRDAERYAHKIEREECPWGLGFVHAVRGGISSTGGDNAAAVEHLTRSAKAFEASNMRLYAQAARRRLGQLLGGDRGRALIQGADVWMASEEVQDPARLAGTLLPGFS